MLIDSHELVVFGRIHTLAHPPEAA